MEKKKRKMEDIEKEEKEMENQPNETKNISKELQGSVDNISQEDNSMVLKNEIIIVRYVKKENGIITNPKHVLSGGLAEGSKITYVTPKTQSGEYLNILTKHEQTFLEETMGLEYNALNVYKKENNYWENFKVVLGKSDQYLNLSKPEDYIAYKLLLALDDYVASSLRTLIDHPKATYRFVLVSKNEENKQAQDNMNATMKCYKEFGKIEDDADTLIVIIETIEGRPVSNNTGIEFLQTKINTLIQTDSKLFLKVVTDPLLPMKVLIKKAVQGGVVSNRDGHFYLRQDNSPLCENNQEAILSNAARYLSNPRHQDILFAIQAKLK